MKKKTVTAALIMVCALLASLPLGVNRSLNRLREDAEGCYYYDKTGFSISDGIEAREDAAANLITVARRYTQENAELSSCIDELEYRVEACRNTREDFSSVKEANQQMGDAAHALYEQLKQTELSEADAKYPDGQIAEMDSQQDMIRRSSYNDEAREFNGELENFPVKYLRYVAFVEPMTVFE